MILTLSEAKRQDRLWGRGEGCRAICSFGVGECWRRGVANAAASSPSGCCGGPIRISAAGSSRAPVQEASTTLASVTADRLFRSPYGGDATLITPTQLPSVKVIHSTLVFSVYKIEFLLFRFFCILLFLFHLMRINGEGDGAYLLR